jgi:KDO2-lipid IV(A) lauroyltransferase
MPTRQDAREDLQPHPFPKFWSWQRQLSKRSWKRQIYRELVYRVVYLLGRLTFFLGLERSARFAEWIGPLLFRLKRRDRIVTMENLEVCLGDRKSKVELRSIAERVFTNFAVSAVETLWMSRWLELENWLEIEVEGREYLDEAVSHGKGVVCLNGHFGNWEVMSAWVCRQGYPGTIVARPLKDPRLNTWMRRVREGCGIRVMDRGRNPIRIVRALQRGAVLGVMIDIDTRSGRGTFVDFFGRPAYTPVGPFDLARKTGAALVPSLCYREGTKRLRLVFGEPWWIEKTRDPDRDIVEATARATRYLEDRIRERPEQWAWFHKRWKTRPERFNESRGIIKPEENLASRP